jgi:hypothetical protein
MEPPQIRPGLFHWTAGGAARARLCELEWDTRLRAHGLPLVGNGREALRAFSAP